MVVSRVVTTDPLVFTAHFPPSYGSDVIVPFCSRAMWEGNIWWRGVAKIDLEFPIYVDCYDRLTAWRDRNSILHGFNQHPSGSRLLEKSEPSYIAK